MYGADQVLDEMIYNLCDNAIKYNNPGGEVYVSVSMKEDHPVVTVRDTGIGIPEHDLPNVFQWFYRVNKSHSKEIGGTGLGLSIVKHGALFHDAELEIEKRRSDAQKDADRSAQAVIDEAKVTADGIIKKARAEAQKEHDELISSARKEVAAAAVEMAEKIVSESTLDSYDTFIAATRKEESND